MRLFAICTGGILFFSHSLTAQFAVSGRVIDSTGAPVPFAQAAMDGARPVRVDGQGQFLITNVSRGEHTLTISSLGYLSAKKVAEVLSNTTIEVVLRSSSRELDEIVVNATRVGEGTGMAYTNLDAENLRRQNLGLDAPYALSQVVGVVVNSDAGNGVGYTGLRVRGTDATRVNVTINGVPVNDAESQGTFWVNMPDLLSSVNSIQVQRGVGTSVNGAGAFGATINLETNQLNDKPYARAISTAGSYGTWRNTLSAGTGLLDNHFTFDARASRITSNGYIDRAFSDLHSLYISGGYYGKKTVLKLIGFYGSEKTYQAWNLVPEDSVKNGSRTFNELGAFIDENGNLRHYNNQVDHYRQGNTQLHLVRQVNDRVNFNVTAHYTKGKGYYEEYKEDQDFVSYYIAPPVFPGSDSLVPSTDLIRRRWLDNDFAGGIFNFNYKPSTRVDLALGGGYNTYFGRHFGRVMWARYAGGSETNHQYYHNTANKNDANLYVKASWRPVDRLRIFGDLQQRHVEYAFLGPDNADVMRPQLRVYNFFNPKVGMSVDLSGKLNVYASAAVANKEPNRNDFVENRPDNQPLHEELLDVEAGIRYHDRGLSLILNHYNMNYRNQLVLNGEINDVGASKRINVPRSYRRGVELELGYEFSRKLVFAGNVAWSVNRILDFTEYADYYDADFNYVANRPLQHLASTNISFSPDLVTSAQLILRPVPGLELAVMHKYVGRQYLDNTSALSRSIDPYSVVDLRANYSLRSNPAVSFMLALYNVLNERYETNGYTYNYFAGSERYVYNYLAPAAPLNFLAGISIDF